MRDGVTLRAAQVAVSPWPDLALWAFVASEQV